MGRRDRSRCGSSLESGGRRRVVSFSGGGWVGDKGWDKGGIGEGRERVRLVSRACGALGARHGGGDGDGEWQELEFSKGGSGV